jgi:hypothetical protein
MVVKKYLMVGCVANSDVLVFRTDRFGKRHAVETVGQNIYLSEIGVGP